MGKHFPLVLYSTGLVYQCTTSVQVQKMRMYLQHSTLIKKESLSQVTRSKQTFLFNLVCSKTQILLVFKSSQLNDQHGGLLPGRSRVQIQARERIINSKLIFRLGDINQPYKRVFTTQNKSVISYVPRCSYRLLQLHECLY